MTNPDDHPGGKQQNRHRNTMARNLPPVNRSFLRKVRITQSGTIYDSSERPSYFVGVSSLQKMFSQFVKDYSSSSSNAGAPFNMCDHTFRWRCVGVSLLHISVCAVVCLHSFRHGCRVARALRASVWQRARPFGKRKFCRRSETLRHAVTAGTLVQRTVVSLADMLVSARVIDRPTSL